MSSNNINNKMHSVKVSFNGETRRLQFSEGFDGRLYYNVLVGSIQSVFPTLVNKLFQLQYEDDEGDFISLSTDQELEEAVRVMYTLNPGSKILKFHVIETRATSTTTGEKKEPIEASKVKTEKKSCDIRHDNVTCDGCGMYPIVGFRFKSAVQEDYDLCEACDAKGTHPHPMIKIADPSQAPALLIYASNDEPRPRHPPHFHHHRKRDWLPFWGPSQGPPPPPPHPNGVPPPRPFFGGLGGPPPRRCQNNWRERHFNNNNNNGPEPVYVNATVSSGKTHINVPVSPFVAAMDAHSKAPQNTTSFSADKNTTSNSSENEGEENPDNFPSLKALSQKISEAALSIVNANLFDNNGEKVKPALRFVRHVTFPDGTLVQPGGVFNKTWRVRNDGSHPWPEGVCLAYQSGDMLTDQLAAAKYPVTECVPAGGEIEITIQLKAPECTGRFISYFRMQTKEELKFGQRLWADVIVTDDETDWHVVRLSKSDEVSRETAESLLEIEKSENNSDNEELPLVVTVDSANTITEVTTTVDLLTPAEVIPHVVPPVVAKWHRELQLLGEMGFTDKEILIPLLEENLDNENQSNTEGMQKVVVTLLSESGFLH